MRTGLLSSLGGTGVLLDVARDCNSFSVIVEVHALQPRSSLEVCQDDKS